MHRRAAAKKEFSCRVVSAVFKNVLITCECYFLNQNLNSYKIHILTHTVTYVQKVYYLSK